MPSAIFFAAIAGKSLSRSLGFLPNSCLALMGGERFEHIGHRLCPEKQCDSEKIR